MGLKICLFCASRDGRRADFQKIAEEFGQEIGKRQWELIYGGARFGLMGIAADAAIKAGTRVRGILPKTFSVDEIAHQSLHHLDLVESLAVRKDQMLKDAEAFVALPGGFGTFDELFEVLTLRQLGYHHKPIIVLNAFGYYDPLLAWVERGVIEGFIAREHAEMIVFCKQTSEVFHVLDQFHGRPAYEQGLV